VLAAAAIAVFVIANRILYYSAEPEGQKQCPPLFPENADADAATSTATAESWFTSTLPWVQKGGRVNDASCLDSTAVFGVVQVRTENDIKLAVEFAKEKDLKVSIAGVKHSMGGHAFAKNAVVLDMTQFNQVSLDARAKVMTVQTGATWHDIQKFLQPAFAVKAMQSTDIFTVGGSISVNAHGMDHNAGSLGQTIRSFRIILPDGSIRTASRSENPELFRLAIGGYGLFGVILDAKIDVVPNVAYQTARAIIDYTEFPKLFAEKIQPDPAYGLMYGHLSTSPSSFLKEMIVYTYKETSATVNTEIAPLGDEVAAVKLRRLVVNFSKHGPLAARLKWWSEKYIEPRLETCTVKPRAQAQAEGEACLVSRNDPMHDSVPYLRNNLKNDTDILQEYFIPRDQFVPYIDALRGVLRKNNANLLNASVRVVHKEDNYLTYAPADAFAVVLYLNQTTDAAGNEKMATLTQELIGLSTAFHGRFFLPYQLHYTGEQLHTSYPEIAAFFAAKQQYDPQELFVNTFYNKYKSIE